MITLANDSILILPFTYQKSKRLNYYLIRALGHRLVHKLLLLLGSIHKLRRVFLVGHFLLADTNI